MFPLFVDANSDREARKVYGCFFCCMVYCKNKSFAPPAAEGSKGKETQDKTDDRRPSVDHIQFQVLAPPAASYTRTRIDQKIFLKVNKHNLDVDHDPAAKNNQELNQDGRKR